MASTDENKALVRRFYEEIDKGNIGSQNLGSDKNIGEHSIRVE